MNLYSKVAAGGGSDYLRLSSKVVSYIPRIIFSTALDVLPASSAAEKGGLGTRLELLTQARVHGAFKFKFMLAFEYFRIARTY